MAPGNIKKCPYCGYRMLEGYDRWHPYDGVVTTVQVCRVPERLWLPKESARASK